MNELSTHIEYLLLNHDCVVVPQFGAFMTMTTPSTRFEEEQLFFPPLRRVRFMPNITADDGLLVDSVRVTHGLDEVRAKRHVQMLVLNLRQQLLSDSQVDFGSIGVFTQDENGIVEFAPCQAGAVTPQYYGLDAFVMPKVDRTSRNASRAHNRRRLFSEIDHDSHITIHISRRALRQALTTAAAIILCVLCSVPLYDSTNASQQAAITTPAITTPALTKAEPATAIPVNVEAEPVQSESVQSEPAQTAQTATTPTVVTQAEATPEQPKAETTPVQPNPAPAQPKSSAPASSTPTHVQPKPSTAQSAPAPAPAQPAPAPAQPVNEVNKAPIGFAIVIASMTSEANATALVNRMHDHGYKNARIYDNGRMRRVILEGYATEEAALNAKHVLQRSYDDFDDAWLLRP